MAWLPTPSATPYGSNKGGSDANDPRGWSRNGKERLSLDGMARTGKWPTPTAGDARSSGNRPGAKDNPSLQSLTGRVVRWPTPQARDGDQRGSQATRYHNPDRSNDLPDAIAASGTTGQLNPTWVEWLMGFPLGHTDLGVSVTQSSLKSCAGSESGLGDLEMEYATMSDDLDKQAREIADHKPLPTFVADDPDVLDYGYNCSRTGLEKGRIEGELKGREAMLADGDSHYDNLDRIAELLKEKG